MIPLAMIVLDELHDYVPEVPLTDWNDPIETFFLDRPYESLGMGVRVGRALGDQHHADACVPDAAPAFYGAITVSLWTRTRFTKMETVHTPGVGESWLFQNQKECR